MNPKEKAKELLDKFYNIDLDSEMCDDFTMKIFYAQRCALICVNEVIDDRSKRGQINFTYWKEVKKEINKL
tara:strand:- start:33 stop:245 length:213 start_codon:yes stop_codon:yes gene_type:complete